MEFKNYEKYRWFYTSCGHLVIGGKNAEQNEHIITTLKKSKRDKIAMHTTKPGSPFSIILVDPKNIGESEIKECAVFTACFSRAWKDKQDETSVDIFKLSQLYKNPIMKTGTWGVKGKIKRMKVNLELALTIQKNKLRAVPINSVKSKKDIILYIKPGKIDKSLILSRTNEILKKALNREELINALPAGGIAINKNDF